MSWCTAATLAFLIFRSAGSALTMEAEADSAPSKARRISMPSLARASRADAWSPSVSEIRRSAASLKSVVALR